jgi:four helix bundle protein
MRNFRQFNVWSKSHALVLEVYRITRAFPKDELFGLTSQMRRATVSVPANICEGCGRGSDADFARFLHISMGSASELEYYFILAEGLRYRDSAVASQLGEAIAEVKRMLAGLIQRLQAH